MRRFAAVAFFLAVTVLSAFSDSFSKGEEALMRNKPNEAIPLLEAAIRERPKEEKAYLYLGIAYCQVGRLDESIMILNKGLGVSVALRHKFYCNIGDVLFKQGKAAFAEEMFGLAIEADASYASSYLNRAQCRVNLGKYADAVADYRMYLVLAPSTPQKPNIEALIALLEKGIADKVAADAALAAQQAADAAAAQALIDQINSSLDAAAADSTSVSVGTGDVQDYDDDLDIE